MNPYAAVILAALFGSFTVELAAKLLNLRHLRPEAPEEFRGVYDPEKYARSQDYTRARAKFDIVTSAWGLAVLLAFWAAGGFAEADRFVRVPGWGEIPTGLAYVFLLLAANEVLSLPFEVYATFGLEARFGFNRTTVRTFVADRLKGWALGALLGGALLAGILAFFRHAGPFAWVYAWGAVCLFRAFLQLVGPTLIMPLFNKFTPLEDGPLKAAILDYARRVEFPLTNISVMDGSKRSTKTNAFFTGFGKNKRIALFDTLVAQHSVPELVAVLAHEIGHYKKKHVLKGLLLSVANYGVIFWLLSLFISRPGLFAAFDVTTVSVHAGLVFFGLLYTPVSFALSIAFLALARVHEYEADRYAVETGGDPAALADALKRLSVANLSNLTPHPFYVALHYSHPPLVERLAAIRGAVRA